MAEITYSLFIMDNDVNEIYNIRQIIKEIFKQDYSEYKDEIKEKIKAYNNNSIIIYEPYIYCEEGVYKSVLESIKKKIPNCLIIGEKSSFYRTGNAIRNKIYYKFPVNEYIMEEEISGSLDINEYSTLKQILKCLEKKGIFLSTEERKSIYELFEVKFNEEDKKEYFLYKDFEVYKVGDGKFISLKLEPIECVSRLNIIIKNSINYNKIVDYIIEKYKGIDIYFNELYNQISYVSIDKNTFYDDIIEYLILNYSGEFIFYGDKFKIELNEEKNTCECEGKSNVLFGEINIDDYKSKGELYCKRWISDKKLKADKIVKLNITNIFKYFDLYYKNEPIIGDLNSEYEKYNYNDADIIDYDNKELYSLYKEVKFLFCNDNLNSYHNEYDKRLLLQDNKLILYLTIDQSCENLFVRGSIDNQEELIEKRVLVSENLNDGEKITIRKIGEGQIYEIIYKDDISLGYVSEINNKLIDILNKYNYSIDYESAKIIYVIPKSKRKSTAKYAEIKIRVDIVKN